MALTFGKKYSDAPPATSGSGKWIKSLKEGETKIRFLSEINDWVVYYEHYNPAGSSFPCTGERETCPGCTSSNERMKTASRKNAVNALVNGYVDVYKFPVKLTNRLVSRSERNGGTITDRDYLITRIGKDKDTEYDLESLSPRPLTEKHELINIEALLAEQFEENFPNFEPGKTPPATVTTPELYENKEFKDAAVSEQPPFDPGQPQSQKEGSESGPTEAGEVEVTESQLRSMDKDSLIALMQREEIEYGPSINEDSVDQIVDWLLEHV